MNFLHCEHISKELLDEIRIKKNVILYNYSEPYSLFPASFPHNPPEVCGFEVDGSRAIFYHLLTEFDDTFDITYVGPDIHIKQNYEKVKKEVRKKVKMKNKNFINQSQTNWEIINRG